MNKNRNLGLTIKTKKLKVERIRIGRKIIRLQPKDIPLSYRVSEFSFQSTWNKFSLDQDTVLHQMAMKQSSR